MKIHDLVEHEVDAGVSTRIDWSEAKIWKKNFHRVLKEDNRTNTEVEC